MADVASGASGVSVSGMRWLIISVLLIGVAAISFAGGIWWEGKRLDDQAKEAPCSVRFWNPNINAFVQTNVGDRECLKLEPRRRYHGVWIDAPVGGDFISSDPTLPTEIRLSLSPDARAELYRSAGLAGGVNWPTLRRFEVFVSGRLGRSPKPVRSILIDTTADAIIVDEVIKSRPI